MKLVLKRRSLVILNMHVILMLKPGINPLRHVVCFDNLGINLGSFIKLNVERFGNDLDFMGTERQ